MTRDVTLPCPVCRTALSREALRCDACGTDFSETTLGTGDSPTIVRLKAAEPLEAHALIDDLVSTLSPGFQSFRKLGQGGMGMVFAAHEPALKRDVAIKLLAPEFRDDADARERFTREAQAAAAVAHPNVISIYQVGELRSTRIPFFVMQFVEGAALDARFPRGTQTDEADVRRVVHEVSAALSAAHARHLVHRDIKPANVMIDSGSGRAIVLDFGISASVHRHEQDQRLTQTGVYVGTPRYMSPEQGSGDELTDRSDVYSLGCVAYELLSGRPVFEAKGVLGLLAAHMRDTPVPLTRLRAGIEPEFASLIARCLEKDPKKRPSADELAKRLAPTRVTILEWPAPGLEGLHSRLGYLLNPFAWASLTALVALFPMLLMGPRMLSMSDASATGLLGFAWLAALTFIAMGVRRAWILARAAAQSAARLRYGWFTIAESIADFDGEGGDLITGSRRFAGLDAARRSTLRHGRVMRALGLAIAAAGAIPALGAVFIVATWMEIGPEWAWLAVLVPVVGLLIAARYAARESRAVPARARPVASQLSVTGETSARWLGTFERTREGQGRSGGAVNRAMRSPWLVAAGVVGFTFMLAIVFPMWFVAWGGTTAFQRMGSLRTVEERGRVHTLLRPYVLAKNPATTPLEAGQAFIRLQPPVDEGSWVRHNRLPTHLPHDWTGVHPDTALFRAARPDPSMWVGPDMRRILALAKSGFTRDELAYLARVARDSVWRDYDLVARSPRMDLVSARFAMPVTAATSYADLPVPRSAALRELGYASGSRAAYFLALGQRDSAEAAIRSVISLGFTLADNGSNAIEVLIGYVQVGIGRDLLVSYRTPGGCAIESESRFGAALVRPEARPVRCGAAGIVRPGDGPGGAPSTGDRGVARRRSEGDPARECVQGRHGALHEPARDGIRAGRRREGGVCGRAP
jgi:hypothetical protein